MGKLGYKVAEIHEHTYTLSKGDYYDFINIVCEYDTNDKPEYSKEHFVFPDSHLEEFTEEEKAQIEKDIKNWEEEITKKTKNLNLKENYSLDSFLKDAVVILVDEALTFDINKDDALEIEEGWSTEELNTNANTSDTPQFIKPNKGE